jgi:hypothetical protein
MVWIVKKMEGQRSCETVFIDSLIFINMLIVAGEVDFGISMCNNVIWIG